VEVKKQTNFWARLSWKWLLLTFLFLFLFTLLFEIVFDLNNWQQYFTWKNLLKRFVLAAILAFIPSVTKEDMEKKKRNQKSS